MQIDRMVRVTIEADVNSQFRFDGPGNELKLRHEITEFRVKSFAPLTYFECNVLYMRMPSGMPQICMMSSLDIRNKSAPE